MVAAVALAALTSGCNRGAAEESLEVAEQRIEAARPGLARHAPGELATLSETLREAREHLEAGRYTQALRVAQGLHERIWAALALAERHKRALGNTPDEPAGEASPGTSG